VIRVRQQVHEVVGNVAHGEAPVSRLLATVAAETLLHLELRVAIEAGAGLREPDLSRLSRQRFRLSASRQA
jgi:hypothetical protein